MESVWDYPRPPAVRPVAATVRVRLAGELLAQSGRALRVLETSHPPTIYVPGADIHHEWLVPSAARGSWCEFKGRARYVDAVIGNRRTPEVGWMYPDPMPDYAGLGDHIAFYPDRVDEAWIGNERVQAQAGDFYGGWITRELTGPFKGAPGTQGW
ncbi:MAG: DUF427 domain-containing protein [Solirubrobacterales bacterium]|nr:DUF427 domain-containing protein [Solirubrobacterales bacterium]